MWQPRRKPDPLREFLRGRKSVFIALPGGKHALISAFVQGGVVRLFERDFLGAPLETHWLDDVGDLHDGQGFNLSTLKTLVSGFSDARSLYTGENQLIQDKPFTAFYSHDFRAAMAQMDDDSLRVFMTLATYADATGTCFPGLRRIAEDTGYRVEDVSAILARLEALGAMQYLRRDQRDHVTGQRLPNVYALNPHLIRSESAQNAQLSLKWTAHLIQNHGEIRIITKVLNQNQLTRISNQNQNHHHQTRSTAPLEGDDSLANLAQAEIRPPSSDDGESLPVRSTKTKDKSNDSSAQHDPAPNGAQNPHTPQPPAPRGHSSRFDHPLTNAENERLAQELKTTCGDKTRIWQCRELADQHGASMLALALGQLRAALAVGGVRNPMGLIRSWLDKGMIAAAEPVAVAAADGRAKYLTGEYRSMLES